MNKRLLILFLLFVGCFLGSDYCLAQGSVCADLIGEEGADPFCSSVGIVFPNCSITNTSCTQSAEIGPDYGCLGSQPFPAWYYLQVEDSGLMRFNIVQTENEDGSGAQLDVDFICYGPFSDPTSPCDSELTSDTIVDCSFLPDFSEIMTINNAQMDEYYLVLITNFSQQPGFISFQQIDGVGSTDCSILEAVLGPNQDICGFDPVELDGTAEGAIRYEWSIFNETTMVYDLIVGETNPIYTVTVSGKYQLLIEGEDGDIETDEIIITFNEIPKVENIPQDIVLCELSSDSAEFDFSDNAVLIIGNQDPNNFVLSYHLTQEDADVGGDSIPELFTTTAREIYVRIESLNLSSCFITTSFELFINPSPNLSENNYTYEICESIDDSMDQAELVFSEILQDLRDNQGELINLLSDEEPLSLSDFIITYYNSPTDAISGINPIIDGTQIDDGAIIYVRVENNQLSNPTGCFNIDNIAGIEVKVSQIPEASMNVPDIVVCATSVEDQQTAIFDLSTNETFISVDNPLGSRVVYFASQEDVNASLPIIDITSYTNISNPQTIFCIVENPTSGCGISNQTSFNLVVQSLPVLLDNESFSGTQKVCVFSDGMVQSMTMIGEDIGATDGQLYLYDWTPDNIDSDNDGNEDAVYFIDSLVEEQVFNLVITRLDDSGEGLDCSNSVNPLKSEPYQITLVPSANASAVDYKIDGSSFSANYTVTAIPELLIGDLDDLEYSMDGSVFQESPVFTGVVEGDYMIYVRNRFGCQPVVVSDLIQLLGYPQYFTPNGDGIHESWNLTNIENYPNSLIYIFDRYGKQLKQLLPSEAGWDGTYNGKLVPSSEYWFRVEYDDSITGKRKVFSASFSLIR